jgi:hypothetical protein
MTTPRPQQRGFLPDGETPVDQSGLLDTILEIGKERQKILVAMRTALLSGDDDEALERARELTGLPLKRATSSRL